jgi:hypothetical protein
MNFEHKPVESSQIKSVAYHPESKTMEVIFHGGGKYQYEFVPHDVHAAMMQAPSAGKFFAANVKGKYVHTKVE